MSNGRIVISVVRQLPNGHDKVTRDYRYLVIGPRPPSKNPMNSHTSNPRSLFLDSYVTQVLGKTKTFVTTQTPCDGLDSTVGLKVYDLFENFT